MSTPVSSTPTPTPERDVAMLAVGHQCTQPLCGLVDFLPFKCQYCSKPYCGDHFLPAGHSCDKYDESQHNRVAPSCPMCNTPVAIPPGQDPNVRMNRHLTSECSAVTGKAPQKRHPTCGQARCSKVLYAPISCTGCRQQFCASHRFPAEHDCRAPETPSNSAKPGSKSSGMATMAAFGRSVAFASNAAVSTASKTTSKVSTAVKTSSAKAPAANSKPPAASAATSAAKPNKPLNPFSSTDRASLLSSISVSAALFSPSPSPTANSPAPGTAPAHCAPAKHSWLFDVRPPPSIFGAA